MTNKQLIELLKTYPEDAEVIIIDIKQGIYHGEEAGLYKDFEIKLLTDIPENGQPVLGIYHDNIDYDSTGEPV